MNLKKIVFSIAILIASSAGMSSTRATNLHTACYTNSTNDDITIHTVVKGETVYSIAAAYNTTVQQIYTLNPWAEKGIKAGDKLRILRVKTIIGYSNHEIEAKETLYSVSRMYYISVDDIKDANPGLNENSFNIGKIIKIPRFGNATGNTLSTTVSEYRVQKGETLYSIGRRHEVSVESLLAVNSSVKETGLKEGMVLNIPGRSTSQTVNYIPVEQTYSTSVSKGETVRVGVLFSFTDDNSSIQKDKLAEYYEGFLLAVRDLKAKGLNAEIYTFDIGQEKNTKKLENLLGTNEMKNLDLIIGGVSKQQIDMLSGFSRKTGIKYVIPFGSISSNDSESAIFQMTTSHSSLYAEVVNAFIKKFGAYNIIFVSETGSDNDKSDFISELKKGLSKAKIEFKTITNSDDLPGSLKANLGSDKNILIPTSSSEITLRKLATTVGTLSSSPVSLFGYPEWQAYTQHTASLHKFDSYIYSIFFLDERQKEVQNISAQYKLWYNRDMINSFPRWAYLGYDTGLYFLTALKQYGSGFDPNIGRLKVSTLQSAVDFDKEKKGYINNGLYLVHYKTDSSIEKTDISR
jgi:LysM repeat protein